MITFEIKNNALIGIYTPAYNFDEIIKKIQKDGITIKNTFHITKDNFVKSNNEYEESIEFSVGNIEGNYIHFNKNVLNINYDIYFDKDIKITTNFVKYFIAYNDISIFRSIINIIKSDIYIDNIHQNIDSPLHLPFEVFKSLVSSFPNSTELKKYSQVRISHLLIEYFDNLDNIKINYEDYLRKKESTLNLNKFSNINLNIIKLDLLKLSKLQLSTMLENSEQYSEHDWQEKIKNILCVIFPKYLYALREVNIGELNGNEKYPDYVLLDSNGYIDIMEIKKPGVVQVMRTSPIRNNFVPQKIFTDIIIQASKYILALNKNMEKSKKNIFEKLNNTFPTHGILLEDIKINNPKGIVLFGRSNNLTKEQQDDFELIKRQYKDITDIMTYDELLTRINNLIKSLENQVI